MNDEELRAYLKRFCFGREHQICSRDLIRQLKEMRAGLDAAICGLEQAMERFSETPDGGGRDR